VAIDNVIISISYIVFAALYIVIHKIRFTKYPKPNCVKNTRSPVENFDEGISKIFYYERIEYDTREPFDAQVAEARSRHRFECVSSADVTLPDLGETLKRGQDNTLPYWDDFASLHASIVTILDKAKISGLIGVVTGSLYLALSIYAMMVSQYMTY
jgi:hypothetical protein